MTDAHLTHNLDTITRWVEEATAGLLTWKWYGDRRFGLTTGSIHKPGGVWLGVERFGSRLSPIVGVAASIDIPYRKLDGRFRVTKTEVVTAVRFATKVIRDLGDDDLAREVGWANYNWATRNRVTW